MVTRVLIAGGGVAGLEAALALRALAEELVSVELIGPEPHFWYRPLAVAEPFALGEARHFELAELASAAFGTPALEHAAALRAGRLELQSEDLVGAVAVRRFDAQRPVGGGQRDRYDPRGDQAAQALCDELQETR